MIQILFFLSLLILYFLWAFLFKSYFIDRTRFRLYSLRDKLLFLGENEKTTFDSNQYRKMEALICDTVQYCHHIDLVKGVIYGLFYKKNLSLSPYIKMESIISDIDCRDERQSYEKIFQEYTDISLRHIVSTSAILILCFGLLVLPVMFFESFTASTRKIIQSTLRAASLDENLAVV